MEKQNSNLNYDDERTNRMFSVFLIAVGSATLIGFGLGCLLTSLFFRQ